jgi:hypothetical protein
MATLPQTPNSTNFNQRLGQIAGLALGDAVTFVLFASIGRASHAEAAGLAAIPATLETAAPFLIGWFAVAPWFGSYNNRVANRPVAMIGRTALTWLIAWPIGLGLRALIRQASIPISFALVTFATVLVMLLIWRGVYAAINQRMHASTH